MLTLTLKHADAGIRKLTATVLGKLGNKVVADALIAALDDKTPTVQAAAALALGRAG